jgi:thiamine phosphate synthase YjbQ (UPF0047 family)
MQPIRYSQPSRYCVVSETRIQVTTLPITNSKLDIGIWRRIFYSEFDGQRSKRVIVKVFSIE